MLRVIFDEESQTSLCFENRQGQHLNWRNLKVQSLANSAVCSCFA